MLSDKYQELGEYRLTLLRWMKNINLDLFKIKPKYIYSKMSSYIVDRIIRHRDVQLEGNYQIKQLIYLDSICDEFINKIANFTVEEFLYSDICDKYVYGALHGVNFKHVKNYNDFVVDDDQIFQYICYTIIINYHRSLFNAGLSELLSIAESNVLKMLMYTTQIDRDLINFLDDKDMKIALLKNSLDCLPYDKLNFYRERHDLLTKHKQCFIVKKLYSDLDWISISKLSIYHPLESLILKLEDKTVKEIADILGIYIPLEYKKLLSFYIESNILEYKNIFFKNIGNSTNIRRVCGKRKC